MEFSEFNHTLKKYLPEPSIKYCYDLWQQNPFQFKITRKRNTKLGDYRYISSQKHHVISVNHNLNPYSFLITYIHEVAHLFAFIKYGRKIAPHGTEWKHTFQQLLYPVLNEMVFPTDVLSVLKKHMINPHASSQSDMNLALVLKKYDDNYGFLTPLADVSMGVTFIFNKRLYEKEHTRRTRAVCKELATGRKFLISEVAMVEKIA